MGRFSILFLVFSVLFGLGWHRDQQDLHLQLHRDLGQAEANLNSADKHLALSLEKLKMNMIAFENAEPEAFRTSLARMKSIARVEIFRSTRGLPTEQLFSFSKKSGATGNEASLASLSRGQWNVQSTDPTQVVVQFVEGRWQNAPLYYRVWLDARSLFGDTLSEQASTNVIAAGNNLILSTAPNDDLLALLTPYFTDFKDKSLVNVSGGPRLVVAQSPTLNREVRLVLVAPTSAPASFWRTLAAAAAVVFAIVLWLPFGIKRNKLSEISHGLEGWAGNRKSVAQLRFEDLSVADCEMVIAYSAEQQLWHRVQREGDKVLLVYLRPQQQNRYFDQNALLLEQELLSRRHPSLISRMLKWQELNPQIFGGFFCTSVAFLEVDLKQKTVDWLQSGFVEPQLSLSSRKDDPPVFKAAMAEYSFLGSESSPLKNDFLWNLVLPDDPAVVERSWQRACSQHLEKLDFVSLPQITRRILDEHEPVLRHSQVPFFFIGVRWINEKNVSKKDESSGLGGDLLV